EEIIKKERPDAILPTMGGQTGLNLTLALHDAGVLAKYGVEILGASIESIKVAEDRGLFKGIVTQIGENSPESRLIKTVSQGMEFVRETGLPVIIRPSFTLGGKGGSIVSLPDEVHGLIEKALFDSPVHEVLIEESLIGWKEFEMEVMRDNADNAVVICSIENVDPMGVHTGDSVTVAPIQTLSDREYQNMRDASLKVLRAVGIDCGGSNVQFAVHPTNGKMVIIEMNPRVSRSSALASKATGFPIALCSARLSVGYTLDEITNDITGKTVSSFEPSLDYCAVKVPRFEIEKFPGGYNELNTQMKSVGESLAIGRTFNEALNKAIRSCEMGFDGLQGLNTNGDQLDKMLTDRHPLRIFAIYTLLKKRGEKAVSEINEKTGYDYWFLYNFLEQVKLEKEFAVVWEDDTLWDSAMGIDLLLKAKRFGFSDGSIAELSGTDENVIEEARLRNNITASYHFVDTCAGEFAAKTPYFYSTYGELDEGGSLNENSIIIAASGPNRIGQGLEFDTCCTLASLSYRREGVETIMVNSNPETVSTDYNVSSRLYLEPLTVESLKEIMRKEKTKKIIVQLGGQTSLNLGEELKDWDAEIIGTSIENINRAEDRYEFSLMIEKLGLKQPRNRMAGSREDAIERARELGYPVLLRPSFVLGGRNMYTAYTEEELVRYLNSGISFSKERPVLVDQFLEDAFEYDLDAVSD
ncbi:MAG: carbamoyl-phosphate synthase large subunit, partial [Spirochaetales bacterium]|nr:carbamoyl-phosphate synthase large subunit [Spirochaetales bacterium]